MICLGFCVHIMTLLFLFGTQPFWFKAKERSTASSLDLYFANDGLNIMSTKVSY